MVFTIKNQTNNRSFVWIAGIVSLATILLSVIVFLTSRRLNIAVNSSLEISNFAAWQDAIAAYLQFTLFLFMLLVIPALFVLSVTNKGVANLLKGFKGFVLAPKDQEIQILYVLIPICISFFFLLYGRMPFDKPIGIDSYEYLYVLETVFVNGIHLQDFLVPSHLTYMLTFLPFFALRAINLSWETIMNFAPFAFAAFFTLSVYFLVEKLSDNKHLGLLSAIVASFSFNLLVLSTTLFRNLVGLSVVYLLIANYLLCLKKPSYGKYLLISVILALFLFWQYFIMFVFFVFAITCFIVWYAITYRGWQLRTVLTKTAIIFIPIICIFCASNFYTSFVYSTPEAKPISDFVPYLIGTYSVNPSNLILLPSFPSVFSMGWFSTFSENPVLIIFSLIGLVAVTLYPKKKIPDSFNLLCGFLLSWSFTLSLVLVLTNLNESYRLVLNLPTPIFSAIGFTYLVYALRNVKHK